MGVVDDDGEGLAGVDPLHAAGHDQRGGEPGDHRVERVPGGAGGGGSPEGVGQVDRPDQRQVDDGIGTRTPIDDRGPRRTGAEHHVGGADVGGRDVDRVRPHVDAVTRGARRELGPTRVIDVDRGRGRARACEQRRLRLEVRVERAVVVEVLVAEVGEARGREPGAVDPVLVQRVRRHLHRDRARARIAHACEQLLQVAGLRGGVRAVVRSGDRLPRDARTDGPDHTGAVTCGLRDHLEHVGRGRLAVGAGDPEHAHRRRRVVEQRGGDGSERGPHVGHLCLRDLERQRTFDEQRHRTPGHRVGGVFVAVGDGAGDAREARSRARLAAVVGDRDDLEVGIAGPNDLVPDPVETGEQVVPTRAGVLSGRSRDWTPKGTGHRLRDS